MFEGYSPETVDFLWGIRMNNNREWFLANKHNYVKYLYEPTKALGGALFQPFLEKPGNLLKVSRIYRDARLHHPLPYKESLWICIRQDVQWWAENGCLFFEINPEGIDYGFCIWKPRPATMEEFRKRIAAKPDEFLAMAEKTEQAVEMPISAQCYKKTKAADDLRLERYFAWRQNISCIRHEDFSEETFGPGLADRVSSFLEKLTPLYEFFCQFSVEG